METRMVTNIALEFVAFAVPRFFKCYGVCKRAARIEHRTYGSREYLVVDLSFELLDDVIVQKILTDHKDNAHRRCDKKIHKSRLFKITDIANSSLADRADLKQHHFNCREHHSLESLFEILL